MRLLNISSHMVYPPAKASIAPPPPLASASHVRQGIQLKQPLDYVHFNTGDVNERFNRFLYGNSGTGPVGANFSSTAQQRFAPPQFCSDLHQAMQALCEEGNIQLLAMRGSGRTAHSHSVTVNPHTNDANYLYSIHARDKELPKVRIDNSDVDVQSNAFVNAQGEAFPIANKPLYEFRENGQTLVSLGGRDAADELKLPLQHTSQALQYPERTRVKLEGDKKLIILSSDWKQLPESVIKGLNSIGDILREFDPRKTYYEDEHHTKRWQ
ncbi:MAG: hypothetical protein ACKO34_02170 [Vampirovibrionales bacterium]